MSRPTIVDSTRHGSHVVSMVVAGSDAPATIKSMADYVCDGVSDELQIQAAINALTAGRAFIEDVTLIGTFTTAALVTIPSYTRIILNAAVVSPNATGFSVFRNSDTSGGNTFIEVIGGIIDGTASNFGNVGVFFNKVSDGRIIGVEVTRVSTNGIDVRTGARVLVDRCYSHANLAHGLTVVAVTEGRYVNNDLTSNGGRGIILESGACGNSVIKGNVVKSNTNSGIEATPVAGTKDIIIADNIVASNGLNGITTSATLSGVVITGNTCHDNGTTTAHQGILVNGEEPIVVGNRCYNNAGQGIDIGYCSRSIVKGNHCETNGDVGINIEGSVTADSDDCVVEGNICKDNTGSGIQLQTIGGAGSVDNCVVSGNRCLGNSTYGISVVDSRCTRNSLRGNLCDGNTSGSINDSGTDTQIEETVAVVEAHSGTLFDAVGTTDSKTIFTGPANSILLSITKRLDTQFVATGMTDLDITVGDGVDADGYQVDAENLTSDAVGTVRKTKGALFDATAGTLVKEAAWNVVATATAVGANLSTTSAGQVTFFIKYIKY